MIPINHIEGFVKVEEDSIKWLQLKVGKLLGQLGLDDHSASLHDTHEGDQCQPQIDDPLQHLPNQLEETNSAEVPTAFRDQHNNDPKKLVGNSASGPNSLDQLD